MKLTIVSNAATSAAVAFIANGNNGRRHHASTSWIATTTRSSQPVMPPVSVSTSSSSSSSSPKYEIRNTTTGDRPDGDTNDVYETIKYWNEHQAVVDYPPPLPFQQKQKQLLEQQARGQTSVASAQQTIHKQKKVPDHKQLCAEVFITTSKNAGKSINENDGDLSGSSVVASYHGELDLNTAWVELLIHEQLVRFA